MPSRFNGIFQTLLNIYFNFTHTTVQKYCCIVLSSFLLQALYTFEERVFKEEEEQ